METDVISVKRKLIDVVKVYRNLLNRVDVYLRQDLDHVEVANYLGLSLTNYYTKRRGERRFSYPDVHLILRRFGTSEELAQYHGFIEVRDNAYISLQESHVPLVQYRRILGLQHYRDLARRRDNPDTWRVEDLEIIGQFMESIAYCID